MKTKLTILFAFFLTLSQLVIAQVGFSTASDMGIQFSLRKTQRYTGVGPNFHSIFHLDQKNGVFINFGFYSAGKFSNDRDALAKQPSTVPQQIRYTIKSKLQLKEFCVGWRRFIIGGADNPKRWNLYSNIGLGLLFGHVENNSAIIPDSSLYILPVLNGNGAFKRLTVDAALGYEKPIGADVYLYSELRSWFPTSSYPSKYLLVNNDAPWILMICGGIRILF